MSDRPPRRDGQTGALVAIAGRMTVLDHVSRPEVVYAALHDGLGLGRDVRFGGPGATGAGLVCGDELVQLTAFAGGPGAPAPPARIRRPSRRR